MNIAEGNSLVLLLAFGAWGVGGWLLTRCAFTLHRHESLLTGIAFGIVAATWLANLLAQVIPLPPAFWLSTLLILLASLAVSQPWKNVKKLTEELRASGPYLSWFIILTFVFTMAGRGLAIFDEFQTIPLVSLLAAGEIPPRFVLNPQIQLFGYHYFLLLFAAQIMRLGDVFPWLALDFARAIILTLTVLLGALWAYRVTRRTLVSTLTAIFLIFATGTRWLLLLFPGPLLNRVSESVQLIGSGAVSGESLLQALISPWAIEGDGPFPFPFAFADGISHPFVMTYNGIGMSAVLILLLLLLSADRRKNLWGSILLVIAVSALALANEVTFGLILLGFAGAVVVRFFQTRAFKLPPGLLPWIGILFAASVLALVQGGIFTEMAGSFTAGFSGQAAESFYSYEFMVVWPPEVVSIHLGRLILSNPFHLILAVLEYGPVLLVFPLTMILIWKAIRRGQWYPAAFWMSGLAGLGALLVVYAGSAGVSATTRILEGTINTCKLAFVPLLWLWSREKSPALQIGAAVLGLLAIVGGLVHFGVSLTAAPKPVNTFFITDMDAQILANNWNRFEPDALVFDPDPVRGVTILGRYSRSSDNWGGAREEWDQLSAAPDPYDLRAAGFSHVYYGIDYWEGLQPQYQQALSSSCVKTVDRADGFRSEKDYRKDYRILLDISSCVR
ncbi:MAG TPA: hypothetical protein VJ785_03045 [Anaerolineales bacterium]|nr:hypothetical protein [Anaerolineales bacterium]